MKVICLDTDILQPQVVETEGGLQEWYRLVKCDLIDIVTAGAGLYLPLPVKGRQAI